jgi:hypothetical protein
MILVLPAFFRKQHNLWNRPESRHLVERAFSAFSRLDVFETVYAITDERWVHHLAQGLGFHSHLVESKNEQRAATIFPDGCRRAWRLLREKRELQGNELVFLSVRNPFWKPQDLMSIITLHRQSAIPCTISLKPVLDHPVQMDRNYRLIHAGLLHFFEQDDPPASTGESLYRFTRPFVFDWGRHGILAAAKQDRYFRGVDHFSIYFEKITDDCSVNADGGQHPIWRYIDEKTASIGIPHLLVESAFNDQIASRPMGYVVGLCFDPGYKNVQCVATHRKSACLELHFCRSIRERFPCLVFMAGYRSCQPSQDGTAVEVPAQDPRAPVAVSMDYRQYDGAVMTLHVPVEEGGYDFSLSYPDYAPLWCSDKNGTKINCRTHTAITGRQFFPEVFIPDRNLAVMPAGMADKLLGDADPNAIRGIVVSAPSLQIRSELDWMRFEAIRKTGKGTNE